MKNLLLILFNIILIHIKTTDIYKDVWEQCKYKLRSAGQDSFGLCDPYNLISSSNKNRLLYELNKMKKKTNISLYFVLLNQFSGNIETLMNYLVENFKSIPNNNEYSLLIFIEKSNHNFAIKAGKNFKNIIKNQTIEEMLSNKKELILNNSFYEVFNEIILDVYYQIGDVNFIIKTEDDNENYEDEDPFGEKQYDWYYKNYEDFEDQDNDIYKEDKRKDEKINDNNIYDYYNEYYDEYEKENENKKEEKEKKNEKEKEDLVENKEKNLKNNEKNNKTLFKYLFIIVLFILFAVFYLYLRLRKRIKIIKNSALNYVFLENKDFSSTIHI